MKKYMALSQYEIESFVDRVTKLDKKIILTLDKIYADTAEEGIKSIYQLLFHKFLLLNHSHFLLM